MFMYCKIMCFAFAFLNLVNKDSAHCNETKNKRHFLPLKKSNAVAFMQHNRCFMHLYYKAKTSSSFLNAHN